MKYEENNYILTSIEIDEQFVDNASDAYMTDEEREYWIDLEEGMSDEETEEESYQMTDEEQKGLEQYLVDTREDVPECRDAKVNLLWDAFNCSDEDFDRKDREQERLERRETRRLKRLERKNALIRVKETQRILDRNPWINIGISEGDIQNLNNHFNA
jgi:hypothetical protein